MGFFFCVFFFKPQFNMHESNFHSICYNESLHIFKQPSTLFLGKEKYLNE